LAFYIWGAHWRHLKNTTEPSMCGGDAASCQITLTTCFVAYSVRLTYGKITHTQLVRTLRFNARTAHTLELWE